MDGPVADMAHSDAGGRQMIPIMLENKKGVERRFRGHDLDSREFYRDEVLMQSVGRIPAVDTVTLLGIQNLAAPVDLDFKLADIAQYDFSYTFTTWVISESCSEDVSSNNTQALVFKYHTENVCEGMIFILAKVSIL